MKSKRIHQYAFVLVLLAVSLFSLTPARADQSQNQAGTVIIHLTGQATSMDNATGASGSATLDLAGGIHNDGNGGLLIQNLTGSLQIGSANYTISTGHGESNRLGRFVILGESSSGELILHGTIQNNSTMTTDSPPSRLSSLAYLALSGSMSVNNTGSDSAVNVELSQNATSTIENSTNMNTSANSTSEITQYESFTSSIANATSQTEISTNNTTSTLTESIVNSTSLNQTVSNALPEQNNITITTTQLNNQTITVYVTNTVANYTITQATTTTVANITITQSSPSITVSNTTVIVTNSTTSGP